MKTLYKTSTEKGKKQHYHILYLNEDAGISALSTDDGHSHEVRYHPPVPPTPPEYDQMTGQMIAPPSEGEAGWFEILPDPKDLHTHEIEEYQLTVKKEKQDEDEVIRDILQLYKVAKGCEGESLKKAEESEKFYVGEQWTNEQKQALEGQARACLTINGIQKHIDEVCGYQRQQRTDLKYLAVEPGDQKAADILNIVTKVILEQCFYAREESEAFEDEVITGRGNLNVYVSFDKNLLGDIIVERFNWKNATYGPHEKKDASDCEFLFKKRWVSKAQAEVLHPKLKDKIEERWQNFLSSEHADVHTQFKDDQYAQSDNVSWTGFNPELVDIGKKEILILECWRKVWKPANVIAYPEDDFFQNGYGWAEKDLRKLKTIPGFVVIERKEPKIRISTMVGNLLADDEDPAELPIDDFFLIPIYGKKRGNEFWGKVEAAKDPQKELNKRRSQTIDIVNKMASYGWMYDSNTFIDTNEKEKFKRVSSSPGFMIEVQDLSRVPQKVEGVKFPGELVELMALDEQKLAEIMNISVQPMGPNESGTALLQKTRLKMTGNEFLFDNLSFSKVKLGRLLAALIQKYYTPERIFRLLRRQEQREENQIGGQPASDYTEDEVSQILGNTDLTKFDVAVSESTYSPTLQLATFMMAQEMQRNGVPVPPETIIELMPVSQEMKDKMVFAVQQQSQAQQAAQQATTRMEIGKTLIAQGIFPPEIMQEAGLGTPSQQGGDPNQQTPLPPQFNQDTPLT